MPRHHPSGRSLPHHGYRNVTATWAPAAPGRTQPPSTESRTKDVLLPPGPHSLVEKRTQCASHRHGHRTSGHSWLQASHRATSLGWGTTKKPRQARSGSIPPARCVHMVSYLLISKSWMGSASFSHRKGNITDANALPRDCYIPRKYDKHPQRQKWKGDRKKVPAPPDPFIHTPAFPLFFLPLCFASPPGKKIAIGLDSRRAPPRRTASFRSPTHDRIRGTGGCSRVSTAGAKQRVLSSSGAGAEAKNRRRRRSAALAFDRVVARSHSANS